LRPGRLAELWWQMGWWQVVVKHIPTTTVADANAASDAGGTSSSTGCSDASVRLAAAHEWSLESLQFGNCHRLEDPQLRPCWQWDEELQTWTIIEKPAEPVVVKPQTAPVPVAEKRSAKRKQPDTKQPQSQPPPQPQPQPQLPPAQQQLKEAAQGPIKEPSSQGREVKQKLLELFAVGQHVEVRGTEEGWWEVELCGRDGPNYTVSAKRYQVQHTVPITDLRPAWHWASKDCTWSQLERRPPSKAEAAPARAAPKSGSKKAAKGGKGS